MPGGQYDRAPVYVHACIHACMHARVCIHAAGYTSGRSFRAVAGGHLHVVCCFLQRCALPYVNLATFSRVRSNVSPGIWHAISRIQDATCTHGENACTCVCELQECACTNACTHSTTRNCIQRHARMRHARTHACDTHARTHATRTHVRTHARTHARPPHACPPHASHTHAIRTHARTHARHTQTHATRTHTRTHARISVLRRDSRSVTCKNLVASVAQRAHRHTAVCGCSRDGLGGAEQKRRIDHLLGIRLQQAVPPHSR